MRFDAMYPLIYHWRVDDYRPYEDFEPHLFEHIPDWQRPRPRPSLPMRLVALVTTSVRRIRDLVALASPGPASGACPCDPAPAPQRGPIGPSTRQVALAPSEQTRADP